MITLKTIKSFNYKRWVLLSVPVISIVSFVTIVTAAPLTLSQDSIPVTAVVSPVVSNKPVPQTSASSNTLSASKETAPAAQKTVASTPTKPKQAQPVKTSSPTHPSTSRSTSSIASPQSTQASAIIATAKRYIGVPYLYGGTTPAGFDCSAFVQYVFAKNGINLPRVSRDQYMIGTSVSYNNLKPGDIVFFSLAKNGIVDHEGIYVGGNQFINAASSKGVTIYTLGPYWQSVYLGAKRVL
ncbi:C40 family peptidase [Desulfosporosinus sp. SB140]|uniref:C40 family peptidase n=1 Tax=Desulfosporosinus paludis TaxID=3115649 RepID=UPI00388D04F3